jgi:hypothetical protein
MHEVAATLIILKNRHKFSNRCLDDICKLMRLLKAINVPKSSAHIKRILLSGSTTNFTAPSYFCRKCNEMSSNETNCSNIKCQENKGFSTNPSVFLLMPLQPQIQDILLRFPSLQFQQQSPSTLASSDISNGNFYQRILKNENENFLSLTFNVDGISIAKSSRSSLWVITFVINELKQSERFQVQNVLVGGIGSGKSKPTREEMAAYLKPIIHELLALENEHRYMTNDGNYLSLRVFLIAGSLDKPAQALVQNLAEPNGAFGCGKCLIQGMINLR